MVPSLVIFNLLMIFTSFETTAAVVRCQLPFPFAASIAPICIVRPTCPASLKQVPPDHSFNKFGECNSYYGLVQCGHRTSSFPYSEYKCVKDYEGCPAGFIALTYLGGNYNNRQVYDDQCASLPENALFSLDLCYDFEADDSTSLGSCQPTETGCSGDSKYKVLANVASTDCSTTLSSSDTCQQDPNTASCWQGDGPTSYIRCVDAESVVICRPSEVQHCATGETRVPDNTVTYTLLLDCETIVHYDLCYDFEVTADTTLLGICQTVETGCSGQNKFRVLSNVDSSQCSSRLEEGPTSYIRCLNYQLTTICRPSEVQHCKSGETRDPNNIVTFNLLSECQAVISFDLCYDFEADDSTSLGSCHSTEAGCSGESKYKVLSNVDSTSCYTTLTNGPASYIRCLDAESTIICRPSEVQGCAAGETRIPNDGTTISSLMECLFSTDVCATSLNPSGTIFYPNSFPNGYYADDDYQSWTLTTCLATQVIRFKFVVLDIQWDLDTNLCLNDYVQIYDGDSTGSQSLSGVICGLGAPSPIFQTSGNAGLVEFSSDSSDGHPGFALKWFFVTPAVGCIPSPNTGTISHPASIDPQRNYKNFDYLEWTIRTCTQSTYSFKLTYLDLEQDTFIFALSLCNDYVRIYDGLEIGDTSLSGDICGGSKGSMELSWTTNGADAFIQFISSTYEARTGFTLEWKFVDVVEDGCSPDHGLIAYPKSTIPTNYFNNAYQTWTITACSGQTIRFTVTYVDVEENNPDPGNAVFCNDYVRIFDGSSVSSDPSMSGDICGEYTDPSLSLSWTTTTSSAVVLFYSDIYVTKTGFELEWDFVTDDCSQDHGSIAFPNSQHSINYFRSAVSTWIVKTCSSSKIIRFTLTYLDVQIDSDDYLCYDYVDIYDGTTKDALTSYSGHLCGEYADSISVSWTTTSSTALVQFTSDNQRTGTGFTLEWDFVTVDPSGCSPDTGSIVYPDTTDRSVNYFNLAKQTWTITACSPWQFISFTVTYVDIEEYESQCVDYLQVYNGDVISDDNSLSGPICGDPATAPMTWTTTTNIATVVFSSNNIRTGTGFTLEWEIVA